MSFDPVAESLAKLEVLLEPFSTPDEMAVILKRERGEAQERDHAQEVKWEIWLFEMMLCEPGPYRDEWGPLAPILTLRTGVYPPPVHQFPMQAVEYFRRRLKASRHPAIKARIADFLWLRTKDFRYGQEAAANYVEAAANMRKDQPLVSVEHLRRGIELARQLNLSVDLGGVLTESLKEFISLANIGAISCLVEAASPEIAATGDQARDLLGQIMQLADKYAQAGGEQRHQERTLLEAAGTLARSLCDPLAQELRIRVAQSFESEAVERGSEGGLVQLVLFRQAFQKYSDCGRKEDVERLKPAVAEAAKRAATEGHLLKAEVTIPREEIVKQAERLLAVGRKISPWAHLHALSVSPDLWPEWHQVVRRTEELASKYPLQFLCPHVVVAPDGRSLPSPSDPDACKLWHQIRHYALEAQIALLLLATKVELFRERNGWGVDLILNALQEGALYSEEDARAISPGVAAFEERRYWEALHVLTPQVERIVRKLAQLVGANTYQYDSKTGEIRCRSLGDLLADSRVECVLNTVRPDWCRELAYLLVDSRGLNLRNEVAHGLIQPDVGEHEALLIIMILLALSVLSEANQSEGEQRADR